MTVGKRIEQYRKQLKLSQEELASQLFVSRQTISQWENNQTSPTMDNFLRLCEVFHVSMNDFFEDKSSTNVNPPRFEENYRWVYSEDELKTAFSRIAKRDKRVSIVYLILEAILSIIFLILEVYIAFAFVFVSFVFCMIALYRFDASYRKNCEQAVNILRNNMYHVCVEEGSVLITVFDASGKIMSFDRIYPSFIEKKWHTEDLFIIQVKQRRYIIKKMDLPEDSQVGKLLGL